MKRFTFNRPPDIRYVTAALILLAMLMAGCSQQPTKPAASSQAATPEAIVEQRAKQRWKSALQGDFMGIYDYTTPGYRATTPQDLYSVRLRNSPVKWRSAEFKSVECSEPDRCQAVFSVTSDVVGQMRGVDKMTVETDITEDWVLLDGRWYYITP